MTSAKERLTTIIEHARQLHRHWFRQLKAIEGSPQWPEGWQRLDKLRSLINSSTTILESGDEWTMEQTAETLSRFIKEEEEDIT